MAAAGMARWHLGWLARALSAALAALALPGSALRTAIVSQRPCWQCWQMPVSIPATRWRKAAASSQAWGLAEGMASAWRTAASCLVLSAGPSRP